MTKPWAAALPPTAALAVPVTPDVGVAELMTPEMIGTDATGVEFATEVPLVAAAASAEDGMTGDVCPELPAPHPYRVAARVAEKITQQTCTGSFAKPNGRALKGFIIFLI